MNNKTAHNHYTRLRDDIDSIWSAARSYCQPHSKILEEMKLRVWDDPALPKCPRWVRDKLSVRSEMRLEEAFQHYTLWLFRTPDGSRKVWEALTPEEQRFYASADQTGARYWLKLANTTAGHWFDISGHVALARYEITDKEF